MKALIYDLVFARITRSWYHAALERIGDGERVLDVGIGTGASLVANRDAIVAKELRITGLEVQPAYLARCRQRIVAAGLEDRVAVHGVDFESWTGGPYDTIYFSASFMLFEDQGRALRHALQLLVPDGRILLTQTVEKSRSGLLELVKPRLESLTTIDFGRVTYEPELRRLLAQHGLEVADRQVLDDHAHRTYLLFEARRSSERRLSPATAAASAT